MPEKETISLLKKPATWYYAVMGFFGLLYCIISFSNHYFFRSYTEDYGFFNFVLYDFAHGRMSNVPTMLVYAAKANIFFNHFSITLIYLVPFYWLLNWLTGSYTLHLIEVLLLMLGGWAMYKIVVLKTGDKWLGVLTLLYYFLLQGQFTNFTCDFNGSIAAACLVPLFIYFFETERWIITTVILVLSLFSREDMPLCYVFVCFVLIIWHWKEKKKVLICLYYIGGCIIYFIIVFTVFIPLSRTVNVQHNYFDFSALGATPLDAFLFILKHPLDAIRLLFINHSGNPTYDYVKLEFYLVYLISGGFLLLYRPYYVIWFIPIICQKMYSDLPIRWSIEGYYSIMLPVLLPISVFLIISVVSKSKTIKHFIGISVCVLAASVTIYMFNPKHHVIPWAETIKENIFAPEFFHPGYNAQKIHEELKLIPPDAKVSASARILPHLAQRKCIYEFPDMEDANYIAIFTFHDFYAVTDNQYFSTLNNYLCSPEWDIIAQSYPFVLLKKQPNHLKASDFVLCNAEKIAIDSLCANFANPNLNLLANEHPNFLFVKEKNQINKMIDFSCDAERLTPDGKNLTSSDNQVIDMGGIHSTDKAHSGKYSVKLSGDHSYGMNYTLSDLKVEDIIMISAWRYSESGAGSITLSGNDGTNYYSGKITAADSNGWKKISLVIGIHDNYSKLRLYLWNNGNTPVYFDDLEVKVYSQFRTKL